MRRLTKVVLVLGAGALVAGACGSSKPSSSSSTTVPSASGTTVAGLEASAPGVSKTTIKIGLITSLTGSASSEYTNLPKAAQAAIDAVNAAGGVGGRQLQLVTCDDASSATSNLTCAQSLVAKGVFAIEAQSAFVFGGYKYLNQQGIPVTGGGYDGPEWGLQPNTNMFSVAGSYYTSGAWYTQPAQFMKDQGVASVSSFGYGISPSSSDSAKGFALAAKSIGLTVGYLNTSLPFGTINVTAVSLALKASGVTGAYMAMDENTNFAILTAAKQAGVNLKVAISATGYGQNLLNDSSAVAVRPGQLLSPRRHAGRAQDPGHHGHAGCFPEVRRLLGGAGLRLVRGLAQHGPHDQGTPGGRHEPDPQLVHRQPPPGHELQRGGSPQHARQLQSV